ncbi:MAG: hypothetical protein R3F46_09160 [bacterium]
MKLRYNLILLAFALATLCGCSHGPSFVGNPGGPRVILSAPVGTGPGAPALLAGESARFSATVNGVSGPYDLAWNFGGAAENTSSSLAASGQTSVDVVFPALPDSQNFTAVVTVTDFRGVQNSDSVTFSVDVTHLPVAETSRFQLRASMQDWMKVTQIDDYTIEVHPEEE